MNIVELVFHYAEKINKDFFFLSRETFRLYSTLSALEIGKRTGHWRKFLFSSEVRQTNLKLLQHEIGDSLPHISKNITPEQFDNWYLYHQELYSSWEGGVMDIAFTYDWYSLSGAQGKLTCQMIREDLPLPIDIYVKKFILEEESQEAMDHLYLILEGFDTSSYNPVYYGHEPSIKLLKENFKDHELEL